MPYEAYFRGASQGLVVIDDHSTIIEANPKASQLFGYTGGELVGQSIELLIPQRLREEYRKRREGYIRVLQTRSMSMSFGVDVVGQRKDGSEFPVEVSLTYAPGTRHGDVIVVAVTDITERLVLEREARRAETLTSLGTVAAGIAHDLNNPLSVILSRSELLMAMPVDALSSKTVSEDLGVIHRQAHRASSIVSGFLELSRHGSNLSTAVSLNNVVGKALLLMRDEMRKKGIEVISRLDRELPAMYGDAVALERVLINLLSNARDAMVDGGVVRIESARTDERPGWLQLTVADNGPGIRPDALEKIFDLLYTSKPGGTGLGLWLSRRVTQEHKGRIQAHSQLGKGATFTLTFPAIDDDAKGRKPVPGGSAN